MYCFMVLQLMKSFHIMEYSCKISVVSIEHFIICTYPTIFPIWQQHGVSLPIYCIKEILSNSNCEGSLMDSTFKSRDKWSNNLKFITTLEAILGKNEHAYYSYMYCISLTLCQNPAILQMRWQNELRLQSMFQLTSKRGFLTIYKLKCIMLLHLWITEQWMEIQETVTVTGILNSVHHSHYTRKLCISCLFNNLNLHLQENDRSDFQKYLLAKK